jgi:hypothetical protein
VDSVFFRVFRVIVRFEGAAFDYSQDGSSLIMSGLNLGMQHSDVLMRHSDILDILILDILMMQYSLSDSFQHRRPCEYAGEQAATALDEGDPVSTGIGRIR